MMMLDPNTVQVLFADLQPQILARSNTNAPDALARSAAVLAQVARLLHLPMHLSVVPEGGQRPELIPELARETEGVAQYPRLSASPFLDEATRAAIAATGRQHLVIAGFATEAVVMHGVRDAIAAGYQVYVPVDACGGMSSRTEDAAFRQIEAAGGVTTSVVTVVTALAPDFSTTSARRRLEFFSRSGWLDQTRSERLGTRNADHEAPCLLEVVPPLRLSSRRFHYC